MIDASYLSLIQNAALLLSLAYIFDLTLQWFPAGTTRSGQVLAGGFIAGIGMVVMLTPWVQQPGLVFDTRSILLGITGLFFGIVPTLIAVIATLMLRIAQGGVGMWMGVFVILATGAIGLAWRRFRSGPLHEISARELCFFGVVLHTVMLLLTFVLPWEIALPTLETIAPPVIIIYPIGTMLLGLLMASRLSRLDQATRTRTDATFLRMSQTTAHVGHWVIDVKMNRLAWSDELWRIFGVEPVESSQDPGETWMRAIHPDDVNRVPMDGGLDRLRRGERLECRIRRPDGIVRNILATRGEDIVSETGEVLQLTGIVQDVTDRTQVELEARRSQIETQRLLEEANASRRALLSMMEDQRAAELKLRESEERIRLAVTAANQGLYDLNVQTGETIVSPEYATMLGYDPATYRESHSEWLERLHPDDRASTEQAYNDYVEGRAPHYRTEFRLRTARGGWKWILSLGRVVESAPDGRPVRMLGTNTDLDERKRMEEALRESEERYRLLVSTSPYAVAVHQDGVMVYANLAALKLIGAEREDQIMGKPVFTFVHPDSREAARARVLRMLNGEQGLYPVRDRYVRLDGGEVPVEVIAAPFIHRNRPAVQVIAVDISNRVRAEEALRDSNERLQELASRLESAREEERKQIARDIHDSLGQELTAIRMDLSLLSSVDSAEEMKREIARTVDVTDRAIATVRRISRSLHPEVLDKLGFVEAVRWLATDFAAHSKLPCRVNAPPDNPVLSEAASVALFRVVQESMTNVARHARASAVDIDLLVSENHLLLKVRDNGRGIQPADLARRGSLGLPGMRERIRSLGGTCEIEAIAEGGTCVTVRVPMTSDSHTGKHP